MGRCQPRAGRPLRPGLVFWVLAALVACQPAPEASPDLVDVRRTSPDKVESGDVGLPGCDGQGPTATVGGLLIAEPCGKASALLLPGVLLGGDWRGAGEDGVCQGDGSVVSCPAGPAGGVSVEAADDGTMTLVFHAAQDTVVQGLGLVGRADLPGASAWLSNGFQSWSQSGMLAINSAPTADALANALAVRGDEETQREGIELSWWYTLVGGGEMSLLAGALTADRFKPWFQVYKAGGGKLGLRLACGGTGESVTVDAGDSVAAETFKLALGEDPNLLLQDYGRSLPARRTSHPVPAEAGWNSWYELWDDVDREAVVANAGLARQILAQHMSQEAPPLRIVVDDGWQKGWGTWQANEKFPDGLAGLSNELGEDGFTMGVWLAPFLVQKDELLVQAHPEWFVTDATFFHPKHGTMLILDVTNPDAAAHLGKVIQTIVGWGYGLLKIDFLFAGAFEGGRHEEVTGLEAYHRGLEIIRQAAGDDVILLAVGSPPHPSFPYVDAWRLGGDIASPMSPPAWPFVANQVRSLSVRWPVCLATLCDADPVLLRALPRAEVEAGAWGVAFAGGALFLSDDLRLLPGDRFGWGLDPDRVALAVGGIPSFPVDPFPGDPPDTLTSILLDLLLGKDDHVVPVVWQLPDGRRVGLNVTADATDVEGISVPSHSVVLLE